MRWCEVVYGVVVCGVWWVVGGLGWRWGWSRGWVGARAVLELGPG